MAVSFLKSGEASLAMEKQEAVAQQLAKEASGKMFQFFIKENEEALITFVDGALNAQGFLVPMRFYQHMVVHNGKWRNFVCPEHTMPDEKLVCPICATGDKPSLVTLFTVIDHRSYQKDAASKVYKDTRKLFVAKPITFEILKKIASIEGGLAGCTFNVSRTGEKSPSVGNVFYPKGKDTVENLKKKYMETVTDPKTNVTTTQTYFIPADYENEIIYYPPEELLKMGFGNPHASGGVASPAGSGVASPGGNTPPPDYGAEL